VTANYWCILNKSAGKKHKNIGADKYVQKHWRIKNLGAYKNIGASKNLGAYKNIGAFKKPWRIQKHWRIQNYWRTEKTRRPPMLAQQEK
jgi:hypothetical protein